MLKIYQSPIWYSFFHLSHVILFNPRSHINETRYYFPYPEDNRRIRLNIPTIAVIFYKSKKYHNYSEPHSQNRCLAAFLLLMWLLRHKNYHSVWMQAFTECKFAWLWIVTKYPLKLPVINWTGEEPCFLLHRAADFVLVLVNKQTFLRKKILLFLKN